MKYLIQRDDREPAYLQLYRQLRDDIVKGIYLWGGRLPSKRLIADEIGVSTVTVEHAYALLSDEGYIAARQRSGYFVSFRSEDGFAVSSGESMLHMPISGHFSTEYSVTDHPATDHPAAEHSLADHPAADYPSAAEAAQEFPFSVLTKTMRRVMNDFGERILERSPNPGCTVLREAIRQYLARSRGILSDTEQIVIGSGAEYLYSLIVELLGREKTYAFESPSYEKIEQVYRASEVQYEMLPLGRDGIESASLWDCRADILHISPYRSFPSGVTASASKRHEYMNWANRDKRYIVEDDFESEFSISRKPEETLFSLTPKDNVIYMNTFSKTISPSLRVGYMVLPVHLVPVFEQKLGFYSCTVPTFMQFVLAQLIMDGDFERHINRVRRRKRRETRGGR